MKRVVMATACAAGVLAAAGARAGDVGGDGDWQVWYGGGAGGKIQALKWKVEEEIRAGGDMAETFYYHTDAGIAWEAQPWLDLGANFRQIKEMKKREWLDESRPHLNATLKWSLGAWSFADRNRLEYRIREKTDDVWRYRNRLLVYPPFDKVCKALRPYFGVEGYEDLHGDDLYRVRIYTGVEGRWGERVKTDFAYYWETTEKEGEWDDINVLFAKVSVDF